MYYHAVIMKGNVIGIMETLQVGLPIIIVHIKWNHYSKLVDYLV